MICFTLQISAGYPYRSSPAWDH